MLFFEQSCAIAAALSSPLTALPSEVFGVITFSWNEALSRLEPREDSTWSKLGRLEAVGLFLEVDSDFEETKSDETRLQEAE